MRYIHSGLNGAAMTAGTLVKSGDRGAAVTELQTSLNRVALSHGCGVAPDCPSGGLTDQWPCTVPTSDPIYGPRTLTQVKSFQSYAVQRNLDIGGSANGSVGPKTWGLINSALTGGIPGPRECPAYGPALPPGGLPPDPVPTQVTRVGAGSPTAPAQVSAQPGVSPPPAVDSRYGVPGTPGPVGRPGVVSPRYNRTRLPVTHQKSASSLGWWIGGGVGMVLLGVTVFMLAKRR